MEFLIGSLKTMHAAELPLAVYTSGQVVGFNTSLFKPTDKHNKPSKLKQEHQQACMLIDRLLYGKLLGTQVMIMHN